MRRDDIQRAIISAIATGKYFPVKYDKDTNQPIVVDPDLPNNVKPSSIRCNETRSTFSQNKHNGRKYTIARDSWQFLAIVTFNQEVTIEDFESNMMENPPIIPCETGTCIIVSIQSTSVRHPIQQQSETGTEATIVFTATLGRLS